MKLSTYNTVGGRGQPLKGNLGSFRNNNWSQSWHSCHIILSHANMTVDCLTELTRVTAFQYHRILAQNTKWGVYFKWQLKTFK